jgi:hypothetical protein
VRQVIYPKYHYKEVGSAAGRFLRKFNPSGEIPVPIEHIVDNHFRIDVVPFPGLEDNFHTVGFTTSDLSAIYVDDHVYRMQPQRYRFTLAHEIGHVVLHGELYEKLGWRTVHEWKEALTEIPDDQFSWMETHANTFAGIALVPAGDLEEELGKCKARIAKSVPGAKRMPDLFDKYVLVCLAKKFDVSEDVIRKRIELRKRNGDSL